MKERENRSEARKADRRRSKGMKVPEVVIQWIELDLREICMNGYGSVVVVDIVVMSL